MSDHGHAGVELALGVGLLILPVALVVTSFGPWSERRVVAESMAAEAARATVLELDAAAGAAVLGRAATLHGLDHHEVRLGFCGSSPDRPSMARGTCPMTRGTSVDVEVEVWVPAFTTPWGPVGGLWVSASHSEPIDIYRSLG